MDLKRNMLNKGTQKVKYCTIPFVQYLEIAEL